MPRATECKLDGSKINVFEALRLRESAKKVKQEPLIFLCIECEEPVKPHRKSEKQAAHFEHYKGKKDCRLSVASDER